MIIFPATDIYQGRFVRLTQGDYATAKQVAKDPLLTVERFEEAGASWLHMVDLDGAKTGNQPNKEMILNIVKNTNLNIQLGGGIRNIETALDYLNAGIKRVIIGSAAIKNPQLIKELVAYQPESVAVGIDARDGVVQTEGWLSNSQVLDIELAQQMDKLGVRYIIYTDIARDGTLAGPNLERLDFINQNTDCQIIASGGIRDLKDIQAIYDLGVYGAICGKSIYSKTLDLKEALRFESGNRLCQ